jgi:hypothetical protein
MNELTKAVDKSEPTETGDVHSNEVEQEHRPEWLSARPALTNPGSDLPGLSSRQQDDLKDKQDVSSAALPSWQKILWREWRNCEDEVYAGRLFSLLAGTALGWGSVTVLALLGTLYGLLAGYWIGLLALNWPTHATAWTLDGPLPLALAWLAGVAGGIIGLLTGRWLSWRVWLGLLTPGVFGRKLGGLNRLNLWLLAGSTLGLFLGSIEPGFFYIPIFIFLFLMIRLRFELELGKKGETAIIILASIVGLVTGSMMEHNPWLSTGAGLLLGGWFGLTWGSVPLGILLGWLGVGLGLAGFGPAGWLPGWLGLSVGFGLGLLPNAIGRGLEERDAYAYRSWYFWWRGQPFITQVESALRLVTADPEANEVWAEPLRRLDAQKEQMDRPEPLIKGLQSSDWRDRFAARHTLVALGGEAAAALKTLAADTAGSLQPVAIWLLASIEQDTIRRLARRSHSILCPRCLVRFGAHALSPLWGISFTCYGCRVCGQSREFLDCPQVVAVLDTGWSEEQRRQKNSLRVNWLLHRSLFDFDQVEIIQATDEDVERFVIQVGNDTDPFRRPRYGQIQCVIGPDCRLAENTLRILRRTFERVEHK